MLKLLKTKIVLIEKCKDVMFPLSHDVINCINEMKNTVINVDGFYKGNGLAIAANQVGFNFNIILLLDKKFNKYFNRLKNHSLFINPSYTIVNNNKILKWEGCLSELT